MRKKCAETTWERGAVVKLIKKNVIMHTTAQGNRFLLCNVHDSRTLQVAVLRHVAQCNRLCNVVIIEGNV